MMHWQETMKHPVDLIIGFYWKLFSVYCTVTMLTSPFFFFFKVIIWIIFLYYASNLVLSPDIKYCYILFTQAKQSKDGGKREECFGGRKEQSCGVPHPGKWHLQTQVSALSVLHVSTPVPPLFCTWKNFINKNKNADPAVVQKRLLHFKYSKEQLGMLLCCQTS